MLLKDTKNKSGKINNFFFFNYIRILYYFLFITKIYNI